jgi:ubiquitin-protein ligase E3 B
VENGIHQVNCDTTLWAMLGGQDVDRLPSASTCYNTLKVSKNSMFSREEIMVVKYQVIMNVFF